MTLATAGAEFAKTQDPEYASDIVRFFVARHSTLETLPQSEALMKAYLERFPDGPETPRTVLALSEAYEGLDDEASRRWMESLLKSSAYARRDPAFRIEHAFAANLQGDTRAALASLAIAMKGELPDRLKARAYLARALAHRDLHKMKEAQADLAQAKVAAIRSRETTGVLSIIKGLTSPGHSLDPGLEHREIPPQEKSVPSPGPGLAFAGSMTTLAGAGAFAFLRRGHPRR